MQGGLPPSVVRNLEMKVLESECFGSGISTLNGLELKQSDDLFYILGFVPTKVKTQ